MYNIRLRNFALICVSLLFFFSCTTGDNRLTDAEKKAGWVLLFDGKSTEGWHLYNKGKIPSAWTVKDGVLSCDFESKSAHGDLVTDKEFENFELDFEWKIAKGGNSGVFINVLERPDLSAAWASGPEYQLLENTNRDTADAVKRSGALFGFLAPQQAVETKPAGEWNQSKIIQSNGRIEFYLNGILTVKEDLRSQAWLDRIGRHSFFKNLPEFGRKTAGHIVLQEWLNGISFRNVKIRTL